MTGRVRKRGQNSWEITIDTGRDAQGKRLRKFVSVKGRKKDAERRLRELLAQVDKGIPIVNDNTTLGQWLDRWMSEQIAVNRRPKTEERYEGIIRLHIVPRLGHKQLTKVSPGDIAALQSDLYATGMAAAGVALVHAVLSAAFKYALSLEIVWRNPTQGVTPPRRPKNELSVAELSAVKSILKQGHDDGHPHYPALHVTAYTGVRRGEVLGLKWSDIDFEGAAITLNRSVIRLQRIGIVVQPTKSDRSRRKIDIDPDTIAVLRSHKVEQLEQRLALGMAYEDQDLVFPDPLGRPLNPMALTRAFQSLSKKAGLPKAKLHSLRHFHASALFEQGESPLLVSRRLGHASIKTTVDVYGHLFEGAQRQAAERFARSMRQNGGKTG